MRMSFTPDDERAFYAQRDRLVKEFGPWLAESGLAADDASYAGVAMDWKWAYQDGNLGCWTVADVEEFLLGWCPRKLSVPAEECTHIPRTISAFLTFLSSRGLLGRGSSTIAQLQRCCDRGTARFVEKMADPANYGLAKGLFARVGGLQPGQELTEEALDEMLRRIQDLQPGQMSPPELGPPELGPPKLGPLKLGLPGGELSGLGPASPFGLGPAPPGGPLAGGRPRKAGPVSPPDPAERAAVAAAAPAMVQVQRLWEFCAPPGRALTQKGNLRLVDARELVDLLDTGDKPDVEVGDYRRSMRSAQDLPVLNWLVEMAINARALRRQRGRLVAVARWRQLSTVEALDRLVDAAVKIGLGRHPRWSDELLAGLLTLQHFVDAGVGRLAVELLDARAAGQVVSVEDLTGVMVQAVAFSFANLPSYTMAVVPDTVRRQLERLAALGVVDLRDVKQSETEWGYVKEEGGVVDLTPAGVPVAIRLAEALGIDVLVRTDPATTTAAELAELVEYLEREVWLADATAWVAYRGPDVAAQELTAALNDAEVPAARVLAVLAELHELVGEHATPAIRPMLTGPHASLAVHVLRGAGALSPTEVDPDTLLRSGIDLMAVAYDAGGVEELIAAMDKIDPALLDALWRVRHPRLAQLLEVVGARHPDKKVAKTARKALVRHRSWLASQSSP